MHFSPVGGGVVFLREHPSAGMLLKMPLSAGESTDGALERGGCTRVRCGHWPLRTDTVEVETPEDHERRADERGDAPV